MSPQQSLFDYERDEPDLSDLTDAEREVYQQIERGQFGVREFARETDRRPGTVGNLLARAREKVDGGDSG
jgi:DNA-directed RNA polymerase specialized sigma24 family protein